MPKYLEFHHEGTSRDQVYQAYRNQADLRLFAHGEFAEANRPLRTTPIMLRCRN